MGFADHGEALPAVEPLDHPDLPERLVAVEPLGEDPPGQRAQLILAPRRGEGGGPYVIAQIEVRVVDPARPPLTEWDERETLPVARNEV